MADMSDSDTNVYVVTSGSYSDYGINRIFSTRELADEYVRTREDANPYSDSFQVEEWALDREVVKYGPIVSWSWRYPKDDEWRRAYDSDVPPHPTVEIFHWGPNDESVTITVTARADQEDKALKALRDRRAQWLMENLGNSGQQNTPGNASGNGEVDPR